MLEIREAGPGDLFAPIRTEILPTWQRWLWRITGAISWLAFPFGFFDSLAPEVIGGLIVWIAVLCDFRLLRLFPLAVYVAAFPIIVVSMPWWLGRSQTILVELRGAERKAGLGHRRVGLNRRWFRLLWVVGLAGLFGTWNTAPALPLVLLVVVWLILVVWSGLKCLSLATPPDPTDFFPDWPLTAVLYWHAALQLFKVVGADQTSPKDVDAFRKWFSGLGDGTRHVVARGYFVAKRYGRELTTLAVLLEQTFRAASLLVAVAILAMNLVRVVSGPMAIDSPTALSVAAAAMLPGVAVQTVPALGLAGKLLLSLVGWGVLALLILPMTQVFPVWQAHRATQLSQIVSVMRGFVREQIRKSHRARVAREVANYMELFARMTEVMKRLAIQAERLRSSPGAVEEPAVQRVSTPTAPVAKE